MELSGLFLKEPKNQQGHPQKLHKDVGLIVASTSKPCEMLVGSLRNPCGVLARSLWGFAESLQELDQKILVLTNRADFLVNSLNGHKYAHASLLTRFTTTPFVNTKLGQQ